MRLHLDGHVPRHLAQRFRDVGVDAIILADWSDGVLRRAADEAMLMAAREERLIFVTYDNLTVPVLLHQLAALGRHHAGVMLVNQRTIRPNDHGTLFRSLHHAAVPDASSDWTDRVHNLERR